jgi:hypothetical protein
MHTPALAELKQVEGKSIDAICDCAYHNHNDNHCAHFVSHALDLGFGCTCKSMTGKGRKGVNIRVHEIFQRCRRVGEWSERPPNEAVCLAFVTDKGNVDLRKKRMKNVPKKHVGVYCFGSIWHYSNRERKVVKEAPERFEKHFLGNNIGLFYGEAPV